MTQAVFYEYAMVRLRCIWIEGCKSKDLQIVSARPRRFNPTFLG
jgi:hypothetical protein